MKGIVIYLTLPAAVVTNFAKEDSIDGETIFLALLGAGTNIVILIVSSILTRKKTREIQALEKICMPAYNIGAFCLPVVQSFLHTQGNITACIFDLGNSVMCTGRNYAVVSAYISKQGGKKEISECKIDY